jgi:hypothetical protein
MYLCYYSSIYYSVYLGLFVLPTLSTGWAGFDFEPFLDRDRCDRSKVVEI